MKSGRVTIKDIAKNCGITPTAVSKALRNAPDISDATKRRIRDEAQRVGYVVNASASSLRTGVSRLIAVIYDNLMNPYFSVMTAYLQQSLQKYNYSFLTFTASSPKLGAELFSEILSHNIDGVITFIEPEEGIGELSAQHGVPVLLLGRRSDDRNIDCIYTDDRKGGRLAAEFLLGQGCKKTAFITDSMEIVCSNDRYEGFREGCGKAFDETRLYTLMQAPLCDVLREALQKEPETDGIFCFSDLIAFEVCDILQSSGRAEVKIVGYDNIREALHIPYRMATVSSDKQKMAENAVEVVMQKITSKSSKRYSKMYDVFLVK